MADDVTQQSTGEPLWASSRQTALHMVAYDTAVSGPAPAVVVLHGLGTGVDVLREVVPGMDPFARLAAEGVHVLALDWPGHGRSGGRRGRLTYRLAMDAAATAVEQAAGRWRAPVGLFGTGLGGVLAFYAALESDRVAAVACATVLDLRDVRPLGWRRRHGVLLPVASRLCDWVPPRRQAMLGIPTAAVRAAADRAADPQLARALRRHPHAVRRYDLDSLASILLTPEGKPDITAQRVPTLLAVGSRDRVVPETAVRAFASRLTCEHELWTLPGGSHELLLEHPRALLPVVARFLRRRLGATDAAGG